MPKIVNVQHRQKRKHMVTAFSVHATTDGGRVMAIRHSLVRWDIIVDLDDPMCKFLQEISQNA